MRIALIFDDQLRPETSGVYCRRALQSLADVVHVRPHDWSQLPREGVDLYLMVDDDVDYRLPDGLGPSAFWAIDTHLGFDRRLARAKHCDFVFAAQKDGAERFRREGVAQAIWLPLACDPLLHGRREEKTLFDVSFVGNLFPGPRERALRLIQRRFPNAFVGRRYFEEMAKVYSQSRIVFNRSIRNDVNMRVFEGLCSGSMLVTNAIAGNGQEELFQDGEHLATYTDDEELLDKIAFYLRHDSARAKIASAGRAEALAKHTYRHRMSAVIDHVHSRSKATISGRSHQSAELKGVDPLYFDLPRPEVLALVPSSAKRVLDVGCGGGRLGLEIKRRQAAHVVGVELNESAAVAARDRLDEVIVGDVEAATFSIAEQSLEVVICADVLEHLRHPGRVIRRLRRLLKPGGRLIASVPNVRFHSVIRSLLNGNWTYEPAGLLDRDHLQFFTRRGIEALLVDCGFAVEQRQIVPGPGYEEWVERGSPDSINLGQLCVRGLAPDDAREFFAYQFLIVAEPDGDAEVLSDGEDDAYNPDWREPAEWRSNGERKSTAFADESRDADRTAVLTASKSRRLGGAPPRKMRFTQDFAADFEQFDFRGPPFAFARFADGERSVCMGNAIVGCDDWTYRGGDSPFSRDLLDALHCTLPGYYVGVSDSCCDAEAHRWYLEQLRLPMERVTFSNIFVNGNYKRFRRLNLSGMAIVTSGRGDFWVPPDALAGTFDLDRLVDQLLSVDRPILVSAGPVSCVIIHKYWSRAKHRQPIIDVGSAVDEITKGRRTRPYQRDGDRYASLICRW